MKKRDIVKHSYDFEKIMENGKVKKNYSFVIYSLNNETSKDKYGISVSKKIGNAVIRNKYKRKLRAIIDNYKKHYVNSSDYIIILRKGAVGKSFQELEKDFFELMNEINIRKDNI